MPKLNKKEIKDFVNKNGFFTAAKIVKATDDMTDVEREAYMPAAMKDQVPEGATYFKAIASNGELNRNGYIIRESAFKPAIENYMQNPVVLLSHDMEQPIGKVLTAHVGSEGLVISGYVFDELTNGRFSKGLFNAVSTGHITEGREFQNTVTNEVLSEEEFKRLSWEEQNKPDWVMAVTALDWLENSIVSIGANRKSLVKTRDVVKNYVEALHNNPETEDAQEEGKNEEKEQTTNEEKTQSDNQNTADEKEVTEESPATQETSENEVEKVESAMVEVSKEEIDEATNAVKALAELATKQKAQIDALNTQVEGLKQALNSIPLRKGLLFSNGVVVQKEQEKSSWLPELFKQNGIELNQ